jgi:hypothetical protein
MRNQNATQSLTEQKAMAGEASYMLQPGEDFPAEGETPGGVSSRVSASAYPTATSSSAAAAATTHHKSSFPPGAIAGVVVGAVAIIALAAALFYFVGRHRHVKAAEAAAGIVNSEKGQSGGASPAAALPGQPVLGPGGMVYVPAQQHGYDQGYNNRMSMPPNYAHNHAHEAPAHSPQEAPANPMTPHSPTNPHYSTVSTYDMSAVSSPE